MRVNIVIIRKGLTVALFDKICILLSGLTGTMEENGSGSTDIFVGFNPFIFNTTHTTAKTKEEDRKVADYNQRYTARTRTNPFHKSPPTRERSPTQAPTPAPTATATATTATAEANESESVDGVFDSRDSHKGEGGKNRRRTSFFNDFFNL